MVDLLERIDALLQQEVSGYRTVDYLAPEFQKRLLECFSTTPNPVPVLVSGASGISTASSSSSSSSSINELWREKICEWSYQVIDHFDFSREVVSVSIHYLDRFLATIPVNKKTFQLAAMTTLYLAIKLYEPGTLSMESMIELSRGYFMVDQMAAMELAILQALAWQVHPPTAYCFAKHMLFLLPYTAVSMDVRHDLLELARFLTELSVIDYYFVVHRPSLVALAALLNAMDSVPGVTSKARLELVAELGRVQRLDPNLPEVEECRNRLKLLYAQGGYSRPDEMTRAGENRIETVSPVCVTYGFEKTSFERTTRSSDFLGQHESKDIPTPSPENHLRPPSRLQAHEVEDVNCQISETTLRVA